MDKMEGEWKGINLEVQPYRETGTFVLKGFDVVQQLLDDHIVMTQSMSFSPFKGQQHTKLGLVRALTEQTG